MKSSFLFALLCLFGGAFVFAQEGPITPPETAPPGFVAPETAPTAAMGRISPTQLLRMRSQLTRELQESQRILGFIDPSDTQLVALHKEQQAELVNQLKEINDQLKAQGVPVGTEPSAATPGATPLQPAEPTLPSVPRAADPTLVPGGTPRAPADPNLLVQRRPDPNELPSLNELPPELRAALENRTPQPGMPGMVLPPAQPTPPTPFDQDQAWTESPWAVQPSKELTAVKDSVESLRKEVSELKETVKDLEAQIRLLNRLLSQ